MKRIYWIAVAAVIAIALATGWIAGRGSRHEAVDESPPTVTSAPPKVLYYRNPMGLSDTSPVPKKDSMGMDYIPVYGADKAGAAPAKPGTVVLSRDKVQKLGVRTEPARLRSLAPSVRASATVRIDEGRQYVIAPKFEGWVERLYANQTGMSVHRGQPLLSIYSPELLAARAESRLADNAARTMQASDPESAAMMRRLGDASRARLRNSGIAGGAANTLVITSPADAVVVEKLVVQGARFESGETILRLADLSRVWLVADVPASVAGNIAVGQSAIFRSPTLSGQSFEGRVTFVSPTLDANSRTLPVRIELPNPTGVLRPGLFGDVILTRAASTAVLTVPRSAVLDSGTRQVVLVEVDEGRFEPRLVELGERAGDLVEVRHGLRDGERVVVSANFLIDAESNLQSALDGLGTHSGHGATPAMPAPPTDAAER